MRRHLFFLLIAFTICFPVHPALGQNTVVQTQVSDTLKRTITDSTYQLAVRKIVLNGNQHTRDFIILREMQFKPGDSLSIGRLDHELQMARQQIYNTKLFASVTLIPVVVNARTIDIHVMMKERWYIYPIPQFKLLDRNLNEWIQDHNASFDRVIYGVIFTHFNVSGRKDQLRIVLLNGFTQNLSFTYTKPFSNSALTNGFTMGGGFNQTKEFIVRTDSSNKAIFYNDNRFSRKQYWVTAGYNFRPNILDQHQFNVTYTHVEVSDSVLQPGQNPHYFNEPVRNVGLLDFSYQYQYINVNNVIYPLRGTTAQVRVQKRGLGFSKGTDLLSVEGGWNRYWPLKRNWYFSAQFSGKIILPFEQAYINQRALGYGDQYLRGLELYVIDGVAMSLNRLSLRKKIGELKINMPFRSKYFGEVPITFLAKTYSDLGYVHNNTPYAGQLNNKLLYTAGFGLDIMTLYDFNLRLEYSFNQLGKQGLFIHAFSGF